PEREDPGNPHYTTRTIPKLVGGVTGRCGEVAAALYRSFLREVVVVSSARVAEAAKLLENIYRSVNIALVNELKMLFERMGMDVDDLRESPSLKVIEILESRGAQVSYNDPYVPSLRARRLRHYEMFELDSVELTEAVVSGADCVLIATDHGAYDYGWIVENARLVVDTRNATRQ